MSVLALALFVVMVMLLTACVSQEERIRDEKRKAATAARAAERDLDKRFINAAKLTSGYSVSVVNDIKTENIEGDSDPIILEDELQKWVYLEIGRILQTLGYQEGGHNPIELDFTLYADLASTIYRSDRSTRLSIFKTGTKVEASARLKMDGFPDRHRRFVGTEVRGYGRGYRPSDLGGHLGQYERCHEKTLPTLNRALPKMLFAICESLVKMFPERAMAHNLVCDVEPIEQRMRSRFRLQENMDRCMKDERER